MTRHDPSLPNRKHDAAFWEGDPFRKALASASIISLADREGIITYVNDKFEEISGYSAEELIGQDHRITNSSYHSHAFWTDMWETIASGKTWRGEVRNKSKDGRHYWVDTFIIPFVDEAGKVKEYLSVRSDITARKASEEALSQTNARLLDVLQFGKIGSIDVHYHPLTLDVSAAFLQLLQVHAQAASRLSLDHFLQQYVHPGYRSLFESVLRKAEESQPATGMKESFEIKMVAAAGESAWMEAEVISREKKTVIIFRDITEKKNAAADLARKATTINNLVNVITDGFFSLDARMNLVTVSPVAAAIANLSPEEMIGRHLLDVFPHLSRTRFPDELATVYQTQCPKTFEQKISPDLEKTYLISAHADTEVIFVSFKDITSEKETEGELLRATELLNRLSENVPGMIYNFYLTAEDAGVFPFVSSGSESLLGIPAAELNRDPSRLFNIIHPEDLPLVQASIKDAFYHVLPWRCEFRIQKEDQSVRWIAGDSCPYLEKTGTHYWYGFMHDITARKEAERRIAESELKNRLIIEHSGEGILFTSVDGRILSANPEACKIFGMTEAEICAAGRAGLVDEDTPHLQQALRQREKQGYYKGEVLMKRKDGSVFTAEINSRLFVNPSGEINSSILIQDITERKQAEGKLKQLALIASRTHNAVVLTDVDGRITWVNESFERITEYKSNEVIGKVPGHFLQGPLTDPSTIAAMRSALSQGEGFKTEILNYTKSGKTFWLDLEVMPMHDDEGLLTGFMAIETDITSLKNAIQEMQRSNSTLYTFMDNAPMVAFIKDLNGQYTFFNKMYHDFMGDKSLKQGMTDYDIFDKEFADQCRKLDNDIVAKEETVKFEHHVGEGIFLEYKFPLKDAAGQIFAVGGISIDITEKLLSQQRVAENEKRLRSITDHLSEGVVYQYILDADGRFECFPYVSNGFHGLYEITADELQHNPRYVFEIVHPDDQPQLKEKGEQARAALTVLDCEYRIVTPAGTVKWLHTRSSPRLLDDGRTIWDGLTLNITKRKELELAIQANEVKLQSILNCMNSGLVVVDVSGEITYANESAGHILKRMQDEIASRHYASTEWGVVDENGNELPVEKIPLSVALRKKEPVLNVVIGVVDKYAERKWININASPLLDAGGMLIGAVASFVDITEQKNTQEALKQVYNEMNAVLNASTDSTFFLGPNYEIRVFNKTGEEAIRKIHGKQVQHGESMLDYSSPSALDDFKRNFQRALGGEPVEVEREIVFNETVRIWSQVRYLPVYDHENKVIGVSFNATDITSRKRAEHELFKSKQYFESLVNSQSSYLIRTDLEGKYTFVNNMFCEKFGYQREELIGSSSMETIMVVDHELCLSTVGECLRQPGKVVPVSLRKTGKNGGFYWTEWEFVALQNELGVVTGFQAVGLDATQRILSQIELEKANARLKMATQAANIGVWEWNVRTGQLIWDELLHQIMGIPSSQPVSPDLFRSLVIAEDYRQMEKVINFLTPGENNLTAVFRIIRPSDRAVRHLKMFALGEFDVEGQLVKLIGVHYDITEQELSNQVIRESEKRFRTLADTAPVFIWMTNEISQTTFFSKRWYEFTRSTPEQELGDGWMKGIHPDDYERTRAACDEAISNRTELNIEYRLRRHDGVYRWFVDTGIPRFLDTGEYIGHIGSCLDITERKEAEAALGDKTAFLEAILSTIDVGIAACNAAGELTLYNKATEEIYGIGSSLLLWEQEKSDRAIAHDDHIRRDIPFFDILFKNGVEESEMAIETRTGQTKFVVTKGRQLKDPAGKVTGAVVAMHDITKRKRTEEKLLTTLTEKELLIKEIHHRIKNNLQLISSMLYIKMLAMTESEIKGFLNDTRQKIKSIAMIHERLLQTESVNRVDISDYLVQLIEDLRKSHYQQETQINFHTDIAREHVSLDVAIYCGLIINELVTNSIKHAFIDRRAGKIEISLKRKGGVLQMVVSNDGLSMPAGIEPGKSHSFGMQLLGIFIKQLNARVNINRTEGTAYEILFK